jgi:hypothetical protein
VSTHSPLHRALPAPQAHAPPTQDILPGHAAPQPPQWRLSQHVDTQPPPHAT